MHERASKITSIMRENDRAAPSDRPEVPQPASVGEITLADTRVLTEHFSEQSLLALGDWALAIKEQKDALEERMQLEEAISRPREIKEKGPPNLMMRFLEDSPAAARILATFSDSVDLRTAKLMEGNNMHFAASEMYELYQHQKARITPLTPVELDYDVARLGAALHHNTTLLAEAEEIVARLAELTPTQEGYDETLKDLVQKVGPVPIRFGGGPPMTHYIEGMMVVAKFAQLEHEEDGDVGRIAARFVNEGVDPQHEAEVSADPDSPKWKFGTLRELWRQHSRMVELAAKKTPYPRIAELQRFGQDLMDDQRSHLIAEYLQSGLTALRAAERKLSYEQSVDHADYTGFPYTMFDLEDGRDVMTVTKLLALERIPCQDRLQREMTQFLTGFSSGITPAYNYIRDGWNQYGSDREWTQKVVKLRSEISKGVSPRLESYMNDVAGRYKTFLGVVEGRKPRVRGGAKSGRSGHGAKPGGKVTPPTPAERTAAVFDELYDMREPVPGGRVADVAKGERIFDTTQTALLSVVVTGGWDAFESSQRGLRAEYEQLNAFAEHTQCVALVENHAIAFGAKFDALAVLEAAKAKIDRHNLGTSPSVIDAERRALIDKAIESTVEGRQRSAVLAALFKIWQPMIRRGVRPAPIVLPPAENPAPDESV